MAAAHSASSRLSTSVYHLLIESFSCSCVLCNSRDETRLRPVQSIFRIIKKFGWHRSDHGCAIDEQYIIIIIHPLVLIYISIAFFVFLLLFWFVYSLSRRSPNRTVRLSVPINRKTGRYGSIFKSFDTLLIGCMYAVKTSNLGRIAFGFFLFLLSEKRKDIAVATEGLVSFTYSRPSYRRAVC